ncbi:creatininase family protein, partial [Sinorhizobium medicae]
ATAERGEALLGHVAKSIIELLEDVNAFDIGELD